MKRKIEILAPAGSYEGMRAAMNAGCDAVYIGGSIFGARAYADNPDEDALLRAIDEAHVRGRKLYLTVNTLLKEQERTHELYRFLEKYYLQGLDAVIVQDVGVLHFIRRCFPKLAIHASTQMTLTMAQGANLLRDSGVTRLVTARELSLEEIRSIRQDTELEIETFVHGALCYCYSGQCLMSSMLGGRSGNRGRCAQPCRMPYRFLAGNKRLSSPQEKYLLSPKDINTLAIIPELAEAGVDSFKIEGRMKRPEYAAAAAFLYRKYADYYLEHGKDSYRKLLESDGFTQDMLAAQDIYNRGGFSEGYARTYNGKKMMSLYRPNHSGVLVGEVKEIKGTQVGIVLRERVNAQDILEIRHREEAGYEFTVKDLHNPGDILRTKAGRRPEPVSSDAGTKTGRMMKYTEPVIHTGDTVYRTRNNRLLDYLSGEYLEKDKKSGIQGLLRARLGEKLSLTVWYEGCEAGACRGVVQKAEKQPMTREKLAAPLEKTGDTLYFFTDLQIEADNNIFVPVAWLNEIRREAIGLLQEKAAEKYRRMPGPPADSQPEQEDRDTFGGNQDSDNTFGITVSVRTAKQFDIAAKTPDITAIFADYDAFATEEIIRMAEAAAKEEKKYYLILPHICRLAIYHRLKKEFYEIIEREELSGFVVKNFEEIALLQSLWSEGKPEKEIILNYNMYTCNREAKLFWIEKGISHFTAPVELNCRELGDLGVQDCDILVYGYLPLMVSAQCLFENTQGCRKCLQGGKESGEQGYFGSLTDRLGKSFGVTANCRGCYNVIYNSQVLSLHKQAEEIRRLNPRNIRLDFGRETAEQTEKIIALFVDRYRYGRTDKEDIADYTTGHFKRGAK